MTNMEGGRFNVAAHGLRGIASVMVFLAHLLGGVGKHVYSDNQTYLDTIERAWNFGVHGVELFFVISGFVIVPSVLKYSPWDFARRRFVRIYPLFFVMSVLFVAMNNLTQRQPELNDPIAVVSGFLFLNLFTGTDQLTPNAWTLTYEVIFYTLVCFLFFAGRLRGAHFLKALAIAACLAFVGFFPIAIYFATGVAIRFLLDNGYSFTGTIARVLEVLCALSWVYLASESYFQYTWQTMRSPLAPALMLSTALYFYLAVSPESITTALVKNRVISYFGVISYSLYLVHPYTYLSCRLLFVKLGLFTENMLSSMGVFFLVTILLTIPVTHIFHILLERGPYEYFFRRRVYGLGKRVAMQTLEKT